MGREVLLYLHFLAGLSAGAVAIWLGLAPVLIGVGLGLPGGDVIRMGEVAACLAVGTVAAVLLFWIVGRWRPLGASLRITAISGFAAYVASLALFHVTA